jgi:hypothetical protein
MQEIRFAKDYTQLIESWYKDAIESDCVAPESKMEFVGNHIFDFTTYDSELDAKFAMRMFEVLIAIYTGTTFEYHGQSEEKYENYILMCNMPFLDGRLEWGTSIRGAWIDKYPRTMEYEINMEKLPARDFKEFIGALIKWVNE